MVEYMRQVPVGKLAADVSVQWEVQVRQLDMALDEVSEMLGLYNNYLEFRDSHFGALQQVWVSLCMIFARWNFRA